jgi:hypothetical protein
VGAAGTGNRSFYWIDDNYAALSWLFYALALLFLYGYSRPASLERLRAWWNDQPEAKSARQRERALTAPAE